MIYLTVEEILVLHRMVIQETGGTDGVRDMNLLFSLAHKPQTSYGGAEVYPNLFDKATVLLEAIANYHVFVDGNKRTAFVSTVTFLRANGKDLDVTTAEGFRFILSVATGKRSIEQIATWLKKSSKKY